MGGWSQKVGGSTGGGTLDWFLKALHDAQTALPDAGFDVVLGDPFMGQVLSELVDNVGGATDLNIATDLNSGGALLSVGIGDEVIDAATGRLQPTGSGCHVKDLTVNLWWARGLVKITQPLDETQLADTRADGITLWNDAANWIALGINGLGSGGSVTNWVASVSSDSSVQTRTGPLLDDAESPVFHQFDVWSDGDQIHYALDGVEFDDTIALSDAPAVSAVLSIFGERTAVGDAALINVSKYCVVVKSPTPGEA